MKLYLSARITNGRTALVLTACFLAIFTFPAFAQDEDVITVDTPLVLLNATVTDKDGKPSLGMRKDQFAVSEQGILQEIEIFETEETPFAAVILIDTSGSMEQRVSLARAAALRFLDGLRADDQAAIYNFDSKVTLVQDFSNLRDLYPRAYDLKASGWTVLYDAVYSAAQELSKRPEKRKAIIVLSDGADTRSGRSASKALDAAMDANATIYTVDMSGLNTGGTSRMQNRGVLKNFAEKTGGRFIETPGGVQMREAFENIVKELGIQYTIGYYPTDTRKDGKWRKIDLKVTPDSLKVRTREGYNAPSRE
ncbi:MAG: VWA domain-containing protein [Acidobacteriota bacterium]|nr:MAG: VWA domain-containing protein [Acidobacteriota bacterium]